MAAQAALNAETGRCIALRVEIKNEHLLADGCKRGAEIDRGRGFSHPALLIGDGDHPRRRGEGMRRCACVIGRGLRVLIHCIASATGVAGMANRLRL